MNAYLLWLKALSGYYFQEERAGRLTVLYASRNVIDRIGAENGIGGWEDFMSAMRIGPNHRPFPKYLELDHALHQDERWDSFIPTWKLPAIVLLVLAWTERPSGCLGYYKALSHLIASENLGKVEDCRKLVVSLMEILPGIQSWSFSQGLRYGLFLDEQLQCYSKVGRLKYHALVPEHELRLFGYFWHASGLQPGGLLDPEWMVKRICSHPDAGRLVPVFSHLVEHPHTVVQMAVNEVVKIAYGQWDGSYCLPEVSVEDLRMDSPIWLYRCLNRKGQVGVRIFHEYLRGRVELLWDSHPVHGTIGDSGWSGWLSRQDSADAFEFAPEVVESLPRFEGDLVVKWRHNGSGPRILGNAMEEGIEADEWVEVGKLSPWRAVNLLYSLGDAPLVDGWIAAGGCIDPPTITPLARGWLALTGGFPQLDLEGQRFSVMERPLVPWSFGGGKKVRQGGYDVLSLPKVILAEGVQVESISIRPVSHVGDHFLSLIQVADGFQLVAEAGYCPSPGGDRWRVEVLVAGLRDSRDFVVCNMLPMRAYPAGEGWFWNWKGMLNVGGEGEIGHSCVLGNVLEGFEKEFEVGVAMVGGAADAPIGWQIASALLAEANPGGLVKYVAFRKCIRQWCLTRLGYEPDRLRLGRLLKELSAMGFFMADPSGQMLQLAPPGMVLMPPDDRHVRMLVVGIWSEEMFGVLVQYCSVPKHSLQLRWLDQADPLLPSLPVLVGGHLSVLDGLVRHIGAYFPGYGNFSFVSSYAWDILRCLENPFPMLSARALGVIEIGRFRESDDYLDPFTFRFKDCLPSCGFPVLGRSFDKRLGYAKFLWWESEDCGFEVDGDWAGWQLLLRHGCGQILQCSVRSDLLLLPGLPLPSVVERALTLAGGKVPRRTWLEDFPLKQFWMVEGIPYPLRLELPRILWGAKNEESLSFYAVQSLTF